MASLDILCFNPFNLRNKIMKIEQKIFHGPSKILKNFSWPINICLKYFMVPTKTLRLPPPTYLMYGPLNWFISQFISHMLYKVVALRSFPKCIGKHLFWSLFFNKVVDWRQFSKKQGSNSASFYQDVILSG